MNYLQCDGEGDVDLQATLAACTATGLATQVMPHHPITCAADLRLEDDGTFSCAHVAAPADDERTQYCLDLSLAVLLIELSHDL